MIVKLESTLHLLAKEVHSLLIKDNICCEIIESNLNLCTSKLKEFYDNVESRFNKHALKKVQEKKVEIFFDVYRINRNLPMYFSVKVSLSADSELSESDINNLARKIRNTAKTFYKKEAEKYDLSVFYIGVYLSVPDYFHYFTDVIKIYGDEFFF